jgi:hypothetical protein
MNEQELRALVREAIDRHLGRPEERRGPVGSVFSDHASHILLKVVPGSQVEDGMCVIEPAVPCTHCGFCQSYGH